MATKHISDLEVLQAYQDAKARQFTEFPYELLEQRTGQCQKVCYRAMQRAERRELIEYGVSLRAGWLTDKGLAMLRKADAGSSRVSSEGS